MAFGFVLLGCENKSSPHLESTPTEFIDTTVAHLTDTVGNLDKVFYSDKLTREQALSAAQDYQPMTGKWFEGENGFNLITSYTSEDTEAGSQVGAGLGKIPEGRSVRFQLTSRDKDGQRLQLITEYVADNKNTIDGRLDFSYMIPDQPNTNYLLSIEIVSPEGVVEDTMITPIFVPPNELNARLTVKKPVDGSGQTELTLYNAGPTELYLGYGYGIYQKVSDGWKLVPDDSAVPAIGFRMQPGGSHREEVRFPRKLEAGDYLIVKQFEGYMTDLSVKLAAQFRITEDDS
ncbi:immunoglobulin-like domain-containing protein [Cohnella mopanensis]|uniref:immunoglobulin-like domain-containing protein n=1 Tax=Cohnella mopanensis TaxID=2911966 RepID=UPI001EF96ABE|nr:immunoglobulin-like domain-containing protein [Cohnella mopanensis]